MAKPGVSPPVSSFYGRSVIASLPEMEIVYTVDAVQRFFGGE
ncbi:MAG TPA: hypothetical protein VJZ16_05705 [Syntrophales bacterium]|nr:hypothetical protein [Syntrophales bacterium]